MTDDLAELMTDDEALGRRAAAAILASDAALQSALSVLRCGDGRAVS